MEADLSTVRMRAEYAKRWSFKRRANKRKAKAQQWHPGSEIIDNSLDFFFSFYASVLRSSNSATNVIKMCVIESGWRKKSDAVATSGRWRNPTGLHHILATFDIRSMDLNFLNFKFPAIFRFKNEAASPALVNGLEMVICRTASGDEEMTPAPWLWKNSGLHWRITPLDPIDSGIFCLWVGFLIYCIVSSISFDFFRKGFSGR